jgi:glycerol-3-phosphate cytidylyltransferase
MKKIITFGTFDLFHIGHLSILQRAKLEGDYLIVGVSSDELNTKKNKNTVICLENRIKIIESLKCVDEVFVEHSLDDKDIYIKHYGADLLVMGDDWKNKFDWVSCPVKYIERTPNISSSFLKKKIYELNTN